MLKMDEFSEQFELIKYSRGQTFSFTSLKELVSENSEFRIQIWNS